MRRPLVVMALPASEWRRAIEILADERFAGLAAPITAPPGPGLERVIAPARADGRAVVVVLRATARGRGDAGFDRVELERGTIEPRAVVDRIATALAQRFDQARVERSHYVFRMLRDDEAAAARHSGPLDPSVRHYGLIHERGPDATLVGAMGIAVDGPSSVRLHELHAPAPPPAARHLADGAMAQAFLREGRETVTLTCAPHHASFYRAYGFAPVAPDAAATPEAIASTGVDLHAHVGALAGDALARCHAIAALLEATGEACACVFGPAGAPEPEGVCPAYALRRLRAPSGSAGARAAGDGPRASSAPF
jgi:hypothetical protein